MVKVRALLIATTGEVVWKGNVCNFTVNRGTIIAMNVNYNIKLSMFSFDYIHLCSIGV